MDSLSFVSKQGLIPWTKIIMGQGFHSVREVREFVRGSKKVREIRDFFGKSQGKVRKNIFIHAIF